MSDIYTYEQAAERLNLPASWLKKHIKALPHIKLGLYVRFDDADIAAIKAKHKQAPEVAEAPVLELVRTAALQRHAASPRRKKAS